MVFSMQSSTASSGEIPQSPPVVFEEFFELGLAETVSPFITTESRYWGANLTIKASLIAALLLVISFALSFFPQFVPLSHLLLVCVYFLAGIPSLIESIEDLAVLEINIDILMTLAAFSSILIGSGMEGGLLLVLFSLSGAMEDAVTTKAKSAINSLSKLSPTKACVVEEDGTLIERAIKEIPIGTKILVKSTQVVPLDGTVIEGISSVNLVHLTGENFPITKKIGDSVPAGARNLEGVLTLSVLRTSSESTLAKIIELVTQAQEARPALQRWFDKMSKTYATTIILLATLFALVLPLIFQMPFFGVEGSVYRALAFLIAASPCALIIAIPIAYLSAVSICAKKGILLKGGIVLDALAHCKAVAFDKTGTLTTGDLTCIGIEDLTKKGTDSEILAIAYAMEKNTVHPIAKAIIDYAKSKKVPLIPIQEFKSIAGYGLEATALTTSGNKKVYIGRPEYIQTKLDPKLLSLLEEKTNSFREKGELLSVLSMEKELFLFRFRDTPRPKIKETIEAIQRRNWRVIMLTGDHEESAKRIATELGIKDYYADLTPEDKLRHVSKIAQVNGLAMIGDGVNDAPALARATVGICMGKIGSTAAVDAADVVLLHDNIELLDWLIKKATKTQTIVKQNLFVAAAAILVASIPALGGMVPLWLAVVMHEGGTVLVGLNALRLLRK